MTKQEPLQNIKRRRDGVLQSLVRSIPFGAFMGIRIERMGNELTAILPFGKKLIGNPLLPALHGGGVAGFMEMTAIIGLTWHVIWDDMENGKLDLERVEAGQVPMLPKTIDFTMDYLRPGLSRDAYARAVINRSGRRYASVHVEAWQDRRERLFAQSTGHFLMPEAVFPEQK